MKPWLAFAVFSMGMANFAILLAEPPPPATGANVDESLVQTTLYVDPANAEAADDEKHGASADAPFATLAYACRAAERAKDANRGVKLLIAIGTYRETAEIHAPANGKADPEAPLVIEAAERDQTIIDGADTDGWTPSTWKEEGGRWTHPWPKAPARRKGSATGPGPAYDCGNLLVVNGDLLREVNALADLQPGTFWIRPPVATTPTRRGAPPVASNPDNGPTVIVDPPADTPLAEAIIQVGVRSSGLQIANRRNVVVRGLLIQHTATPGSNALGVNITHCSNVLIEDVLSQWNDGYGMLVGHGADVTLRRTRVLHNGSTGLAVADTRNVLAEDGETSFNNFRGEWANWIDPRRPVGIIAQQVAGSTWRRQRVVSNAGRALWFAEDTNLTVEEAVVRDNVVSGLLFDSSGGPTLIRRSLVVGTKLPPGAMDRAVQPAAVSIYACPDVTLEGNVLAANVVPAFGLRDALPGDAPFTNRQGGPATHGRSERHTLRRNLVYGQDAGQILGDWPGADRLGPADFSSYYGTLTLAENCFWNPASADVFQTYDKNGPHGPPLNFDAWLAFLTTRAGGGGKTLLGSVWQDPLFLDPGEGDFRLRENSPVKDWDLLIDENSAGQ